MSNADMLGEDTEEITSEHKKGFNSCFFCECDLEYDFFLWTHREVVSKTLNSEIWAYKVCIKCVNDSNINPELTPFLNGIELKTLSQS